MPVYYQFTIHMVSFHTDSVIAFEQNISIIINEQLVSQPYICLEGKIFSTLITAQLLFSNN